MYIRVRNYPELRIESRAQERQAMAAILSASLQVKVCVGITVSALVALTLWLSREFHAEIRASAGSILAFIAALYAGSELVRAVLIGTIYRQAFLRHKEEVLSRLGAAASERQ